MARKQHEPAGYWSAVFQRSTQLMKEKGYDPDSAHKEARNQIDAEMKPQLSMLVGDAPLLELQS